MTIDNDIAVTDHAPGYGSAARYIASVVTEIDMDLQALPIHVCVVEAMGRNAGWITAASALGEGGPNAGPDLICLPEVPFNEELFLDEAGALFRKKGYVLAVASEGLKKQNGDPVVEPIFTVGRRSVYYGDTGSYLANLVIKNPASRPGAKSPVFWGGLPPHTSPILIAPKQLPQERERRGPRLKGRAGLNGKRPHYSYRMIHCEERKALAAIISAGEGKNFAAVNSILNREIKCAQAAGLKVLYCIGEKAEEQQEWEKTLRAQLEGGLEGVDTKNICVAYEPVWAIGPSKAPPDSGYIARIAKFVKKETGGLPVVYGGGLKKENAAQISSIPEIDGGLIALTRFAGEIGFYPDEYIEIIRAYLNR